MTFSEPEKKRILQKRYKPYNKIFIGCTGFADELQKARKLGTLKQYIVGRSSEATFSDAFEKQEAILRYLGAFDLNGEVGFCP